MPFFEQIEYAARTDVGIRRSHNQDAHAVQRASDVETWNRQGHVFLPNVEALEKLAATSSVSVTPVRFTTFEATSTWPGVAPEVVVHGDPAAEIRGPFA